jgi:hypothetical protein
MRNLKIENSSRSMGAWCLRRLSWMP